MIDYLPWWMRRPALLACRAGEGLEGSFRRRAVTRTWVAVSALVLAVSGVAGAAEGRIAFGRDVASGLARAAKERKPVALYFTADW